MIKDEWVVAAIQMVSSDRVDENLRAVEQQVSQAAANGAEMVVLPEKFALMARY